MSYNVCPCFLCRQPMSYEALREGVFWTEQLEDWEWQLISWMEDSPRTHFVHKACWKRLSEKRRVEIRESSMRNEEPRTIGAIA